MDLAARVLIIAGIAFVFSGLLLLGAARLGLGRLPGDIVVEGQNARFFFPIATSLLLSVVLTIVANVVLRLWR